MVFAIFFNIPQPKLHEYPEEFNEMPMGSSESEIDRKWEKDQKKIETKYFP